MIEKLWVRLSRKIVEDGFFTAILDVIRMFITLVLKVIYRLIMLCIEGIFTAINKLTQLIDVPMDYIVKFFVSITTPVQNNKIIFLTFQGDYTCNPKMICEEIIRRNLDYELVWDVKSEVPTSDYPLKLNFVQHNTLSFYKELASAKVIIENTNIVERLHMNKKKNQVLMQTWHGSLGIKRLDGDVVMGLKWKMLSRSCQKKVDLLLSNSDFETEVFRTAYWKNVPSIQVGHARNDIFFWDDEEKKKIRHKVNRILNIPEDRKIFLFAPTHRDNVNESYEALDYGVIRNALEERFGGEWQIVVRVHNRLKKQSRDWLVGLPSFVSDGTMYEDMQELLAVTDVGVTDFSSWIFDYMLSGKPGFIIEIGMEDFQNQRGFYYPIETTPFPIAKNSLELAQRIREFDEEKYKVDSDRFLKERGCMEDGHASERIVDKIEEFVKGV